VLVSDVHYPEDLQALLNLMRSLPDLLLYAGGTGLLRERGSRVLSFSPAVACLHRIPELRKSARTEGYIELGAMKSISEILSMASGTLPSPIDQIARGMMTHPLRNLATLGGNLATPERFMDLWAPLACMDALVELRSQESAKWVNLNRLVTQDGRPAFPKRTLLARVRIPLDAWDCILVAKTGVRDWPAEDTGIFLCMAKTGRGIIDEFRLLWAGERMIRSRDIEANVSGRKLPLSEREAAIFQADYRKHFSSATADAGCLDSVAPILQALIDTVFERLSR
jgi:CO/xanthine dehydrogenase FAD-binding subunit